jgi:hypothetical protein
VSENLLDRLQVNAQTLKVRPESPTKPMKAMLERLSEPILETGFPECWQNLPI